MMSVHHQKKSCRYSHLSLLLPRLQLKDAARLLKEVGVLITDSREGLFLIRLVGFRSSLQSDSLSERREGCRKGEAKENVKNERQRQKALTGQKRQEGNM